MTAPQSENRSPGLRAFQIVMMIIPTIAIILRFWSRTLAYSKKPPRFWWDDWVALVALPFSISTNAIVLYYISIGLGKHFETISLQKQVHGLEALFAVYFTYDLGISLAKTSALFFYSRVFTTHNPRFRWALWTTQVLVLAWIISILISTVLLCIPVQKSWLPKISGHCENTQAVWLGSAISSVVIDLIILLFPLPMLWSLQTKLSRKIFISGVLLCGYGVIVISLGRMITLIRVGETLFVDITYNAVTPIYWQGAEAPFSILCICLPSIFFLFRRGARDGVSALFTSSSAASRARLKGGDQFVTDGPFPAGSRSIMLDRSNNSGHSISGDGEAHSV